MTTKSLVLGSLLGILLVFFTSTTAWAAQRTLTADGNGGYYINMSTSGIDTLVVPDGVTTFKVYDDGGPDRNFSRNCDGRLVIKAPEGNQIRFSGNLYGLYVDKYRYSVGELEVYEGVFLDNCCMPSLYSDMGERVIPRTLSSSNIVTFRFHQYSTKATSAGIDVTVTVVDASAPYEIMVEDVSGGSVVCNQTEANTGASVTFTANADEGYVLDYVTVIDERRDSVEVIGGRWFAGNEATFTMPNAAVTIIPTFVTEDEGPGYHLPEHDIGWFNVPEGTKAFRILPFITSSRVGDTLGTLVVTAPEGYLLQVQKTGSLWFAFEGDISNLGNEIPSTLNGYASSGRVMSVISFQSRTEAEDKISDFHIRLVEANVAHSINVEESDCGRVVSDLESALVGTTVTLTATPNEGCMLSGIEVIDDENGTGGADGYPYGFINVTGGAWYTGNQGTFKMPYGNVRVIPHFIETAKTAEEGLFINIPEKDTIRVNLSSDISSLRIFDYRGQEMPYGDNNDGYLVLTAPEGSMLQITGVNVETIDGNNYLSVRDGNDANAQEILKMWGMKFEQEGNEPSLPIVASGRTLTFHFKSDDQYIRVKENYDWGWAQRLLGVELIVEVYDPNKQFYIDMYEVSEGDAVSDLTKATAGQMVTVTATPNNGYVFKGVVIYDANTGDELIQVTDGAWYNNSVKFAMPNRNIGIYPYFEKTKNAEIAIPRKDTIKANIPYAIKWIDVSHYNGYYSNNNDGTLTLTAPEGCILFIEGGYISIYDKGDSLIIYDGSSVSDDKLAEISAYDGIGELRSTGRSLTFHFKSDDYGSSYGAEFRVGVTGANGTHRIVSGGMWGGHVAFDKNMAAEGDTVVVTAVPDDDFALSYVQAIWYNQYDNEYPIDMIGGTWYNNEARFVMPAGDVEVSARFYEMEYNTFYAYIPESDALTANIPEGMKWITVYNNREYGDYGNYFNNSNGSLTLVAPEGHKLFVDDISFAIADEGDSLVIFDGADTNQVRLAKISLGDEVGEIRSTGQSLTFQFKSNDEGTAGGVYIDVGVVNVSGKFRISLPDCNNGSITVDKKSALEGDTVTITANPKEGYLLSDLEVSWYDSESRYHYIDVSGGTWYNNEGKFVMPAGDVKISAYFNMPENGNYYVAIPQTDTLKLDIPEGMQYIECSPEGEENEDEDWVYYNNNNGVLVLTAPEGYAFYVGGNNDLADIGDSLTIYDGADASARKLAEISFDDGIGSLVSSGRSLTFRFKSDASGNSYGPELYLMVVKKSGSAAVAILEDSDGYKMARIDGAYNGKDTVNIEEDIEVNGVEFNREFSTAEDGYSTLMLPFDVSTHDARGIQTVLAFNDVIDSIVDGVKKKFVVMQALWDADTSSQDIVLKANMPYLVKMWNSQLSIDGPVTLRKTENTVLTLGDWQVHGTTAYKKWQTGDPELGSVYGFAANAKDGVKIGQFVKAGTGAFIRPMRAYLIYNPNNPEPKPAPANHVSVWRDNELPEEIDIVVVSGNRRAGIAGGETQPGDDRTVIGTINTRTGEIKFKRTYDLKGRPVSGTPKAKGMYIKGKR
jgi:hypothetical protein